MARINANTGLQSGQLKALRRRVLQMYASFNQGLWNKCLSLLDLLLRERTNLEPAVYAEQLHSFKNAYGRIDPWHMRISLHLDASSNKHDSRPFAYVYVVWQDASHGFHMFRERWVQHDGRWFTRVVGMVPNGRTGA
jgi:hypothetical protein